MKSFFSILILAILTSSISAAQTWDVIQLTDNSYEDRNYKINAGGHVVWEGYDGNDWEIFYYDGTEVHQITDNDFDDTSPNISDTDYIVWEQKDTVTYAWDEYKIWRYHSGTSELYGDREIYDDRHPDVNSDGVVVWEAKTADNYWEIFLLDDGGTRQISENHDYPSYYGNAYPQISDDGLIVWEFYDGAYVINRNFMATYYNGEYNLWGYLYGIGQLFRECYDINPEFCTQLIISRIEK
jgi:hypothetical protein